MLVPETITVRISLSRGSLNYRSEYYTLIVIVLTMYRAILFFGFGIIYVFDRRGIKASITCEEKSLECCITDKTSFPCFIFDA
jgi:hypothetical protein